MDKSLEPADFDLEDKDIQADPYRFYPSLREQRPVLKTRLGGRPCWVISRREDIVAILMDPATYSSRTMPVPNMLFLDRPDHDRLRAMVTDRFTRKAVGSMAPAMAEAAEKLIGACVAKGRCDIVGDFASPLTIAMIAKLLGIAPGQIDLIRQWTRGFTDYLFAITFGETPDEAALMAAEGLSALMTDIVEEARYADDSVMAILVAQLREGRLTHEEFVHHAILLFLAGHTTTTNLIAGAVYMLAQRRQDLDRICEDREFVAGFVEEVLRTRPSFQRIMRVATRDVELHGEHIPAGADIRLLLGSANRDPAFFPDGERFDPERKGRMHSTFGHGIHTCLGSWLGRLEAETALTVFARHVASVALDPDQASVPVTGGTFNEFGFEALPVILQPRQPAYRAAPMEGG